MPSLPIRLAMRAESRHDQGVGIERKIGALLRRIFLWPVGIVLAVNVENWASNAGFGNIVFQHWKATVPMLTDLYELATSSAVIYPTLFCGGMLAYEFGLIGALRAERKSSWFRMRLVRSLADPAAEAFFKPGLVRRMTFTDRDLPRLNRRLIAAGLDVVPETFDGPEETNKIYGAYLMLISRGEISLAQDYLKKSGVSSDVDLSHADSFKALE